jgi:hypothetical protein
MGAAFTILRRNIMSAVWAYRFVLAVAFVLAVLGFGPSTARMNWLVDFEVWLTNHTRDPIATAFLAGLILSTWVLPVVWSLVKHRFDDPQPDIPIADAINYIVNDSAVQLRKAEQAQIAAFGPGIGQKMQQGGVAHAHAREILFEKIITGDLNVWGRREHSKGMAFKLFESHRRPIDKSLWNHAVLEWFSVFYNSKDISQTVMQEGHTDYCYAELMLSREQVRRLWPNRAWSRRIWSDAPRADYWGRPLDKHYRLITPPSKFEPPYPYDSSPPPPIVGTDTIE